MPRLLGVGRRRRENRAEASKAVTLHSAGGELTVTMLDLSTKGVSILTGSPPQPDQEYVLAYMVGGMALTAELEVVRWTARGDGFVWGCRRRLLSKEETSVRAPEPRQTMTHVQPRKEQTPMLFSSHHSEESADVSNVSAWQAGGDDGTTRSGLDHPDDQHDSAIVLLERETCDSGAAERFDGEPLGEAELRRQLDDIDAELVAAEEQLLVIENIEREAFERHDKPALDAVWTQHDAHLQERESLRVRREATWQELIGQAKAQIERWRTKAESQVQAWRNEGQEVVERMLNGLQDIEGLLAQLQTSPQRQAEERQSLLTELEGLRYQDLPVELPQPQVDWSVPFPELESLADRLDHLSSTCRDLGATERLQMMVK